MLLGVSWWLSGLGISIVPAVIWVTSVGKAQSLARELLQAVGMAKKKKGKKKEKKVQTSYILLFRPHPAPTLSPIINVLHLLQLVNQC